MTDKMAEQRVSRFFWSLGTAMLISIVGAALSDYIPQAPAWQYSCGLVVGVILGAWTWTHT